ncbi:MAG: 16S rRNA (guanine(527)-N(7))-methyltransferase RsmG [Micrococcales bacterium]|nr:16S rRNA (guanine(527)-N(7))-methyltransferase RsmG [Micrococcales bacterium]
MSDRDLPDDSAQTVELEPAGAELVLGGGGGAIRSFSRDLAARGEKLGLIGPSELPRLWTRHILNSALLAPLLRANGTLADVGSGAGFPGLVLAAIRPDVAVTLIEPMERRVEWLVEQARRLELDNVTVVRARAEDVRPRRAFDQVTARAVSALRTLIPLTAALARPGGELLLLKGARVDEELRAAQNQVRTARLHEVRVEMLGAAGGPGPAPEATRVFRATVA